MNFAKNTVCLQCDAKRPKRQLLPGEWECPQYVSLSLSLTHTHTNVFTDAVKCSCISVLFCLFEGNFSGQSFLICSLVFWLI